MKENRTTEMPGFNGLIELTDKEFSLISNLIYDTFGINLPPKKKALVRGRLNKLVRSLGYTDFGEYYEDILADKTGRSLLQLVDKISTNHTFFFREQDHFVILQQMVLPQLLSPPYCPEDKTLRIWCAGCATGEEAYSLAIVFREFRDPKFINWEPAILATDISLSALETAQEGVYPSDRIKQVPGVYQSRYFTSVPGGQYSVKPVLRKMILFKRLNLLQKVYPFKGKFHIIFLRNVMIYFDVPTRQRIIKLLARYIQPGGYLFLGHSETLGRNSEDFKYIKPAVYRRL